MENSPNPSTLLINENLLIIGIMENFLGAMIIGWSRFFFPLLLMFSVSLLETGFSCMVKNSSYMSAIDFINKMSKLHMRQTDNGKMGSLIDLWWGYNTNMDKNMRAKSNTSCILLWQKCPDNFACFIGKPCLFPLHRLLHCYFWKKQITVLAGLLK